MIRPGLVLTSLLALSACGVTDAVTDAVTDIVSDDVDIQERKFQTVAASGTVTGEEPQAVLEMREVMESGGNAADAVIAGFFKLSLTYPLAVSPASGGACMVYEGASEDILEREEARVRYLSFPVTRPAAGGRIGVPGAMRGLWTLHNEYGLKKWGALVVPRMLDASRGVTMSRALHRRLTPFVKVINARPGLRRLVSGPTGELASIGDVIKNVEMVPLLSAFGQKGPSALYSGALASRFVEEANNAGGNLTLGDLQSYRPEWSEPVLIPSGDEKRYWSNNTGGLQAGRLVASVSGQAEDLENSEDMIHLLAEGSAWLRSADAEQAGNDSDGLADGFEAFYSKDSHRSVAPQTPVKVNIDGGVAALTAVDTAGLGITCAFGLNGPFGAGAVAPSLGLVLPAAPSEGKKDTIDQIPLMISTFGSLNRIAGVIAATGGIAAPQSLATSLLVAKEQDRGLEEGMGEPRSIAPGNPDIIFVEDVIGDDKAAILSDKGHQVRMLGLRMGRVQGYQCRYYATQEDPVCGSAIDKRAAGLSATF